MNETTLETASRQQLNQFIDDLRKELVLNRMHLAESGKQTKSLLARLQVAESTADSLRQYLNEREQIEVQLRNEFEKHLLFKEAELAKVKQLIAEKDASLRELSRNAELPQNDNSEAVQLEALNRALASEMEERLSQKTIQLEKLSLMVEAKDALLNRLSVEFNKQLAAKEEQIKQLSDLVRKNSSELTSAEKYKTLVKIAEDANGQVSEENSSLKKEIVELHKIISMRDSILKDEAARFEEFSLEINRKADERVRELIKEFSAKELALKLDLEQAKAKLSEQELTVSAKQKEIDIALDTFATVSQQVLNFKTPDAMIAYKEKELNDREKVIVQKSEQLSIKETELKGVLEDISTRENALSERENELSVLLRKAEEKADLLNSSESEMKRREDILMMQQQAFQKQMAMLEELGYEFKEVKEEQLPKQVERSQPAPILVPAEKSNLKPIKLVVGEPAVQPRILKMLNPRQVVAQKEVLEAPMPPKSVFEEKAINKVVQVPARGIEVKPAPAQEQTSHEVMFGRDREGFPEIEEIIAMIEVAKEHGDSDEMIKASLVGSGYSKDKVESAFKKFSGKI